MAQTTNDVKRTPAVAVEIDGTSMVLTFANGRILPLDETVLTAEVRTHAMMHGLKQKLVDAAAIARNPDTGRSATIEDKYEAVKVVYDRLLSGLWNAPRGEGGAGSGGLLFRALVRMYPNKTPESLREFLSTKSAAEQAALRKNPRVAAIIDELRAATARDDGESLLNELE